LEYRIGYVENEWSYKYHYVQSHAGKIEYLILGHSLTNLGFNPNILGENAFCFAINARTLFYDVKLSEQFVPKMKSLKAVLYPLHPGLPASYHTEPYLKFCYARYMGITSQHYIKDRSALLSGQLTINNFKRSINCDTLGFSPKENVYDGITENNVFPDVALARDHQALYTEYILQLASLCQKNNVRLILFLPPVTNRFFEATDPTIISMMDSIAEFASNKFSAEYHNYFNDQQFRSDSLYADEIHLNHRGATLFAKRVKSDFHL
jgi:hypothetical protein